MDEKDLNVGDIVRVMGNYGLISFNGEIGQITLIEYQRVSHRVLVKFKTRFNDDLHNAGGMDPDHRSYWVDYDNIYPLTSKAEKRKRKTNLEDDPWNEENWGWEEIKEQNNEDVYDDLAIIVNDEEEYYRITRFLFSLGYSWFGFSSNRELRYTHDKYIITHKSKHISSPTNVSRVKLDDKTIISCDELMTIRGKPKKKYNLEDDPWGEENWGWEDIKENKLLKYKSFNYINEQSIENFYVGQHVSLREELIGKHDGYPEAFSREMIGKNDGTITYININYTSYPISVNWNTDNSFNYSPDELVPFEKKQRKIRKKQNLEDDPWNEENWGWEEIKESNKLNDFNDYMAIILNNKPSISGFKPLEF